MSMRRVLRALTLGVIASTVLFGGLETPSPRAAAAVERGACVDGFDFVSPTSRIVPEDVHGPTADRLLAAGAAPTSGGRRVARTARLNASGWHTASTQRIGIDAGYVGIGGTNATGLWAVGYVQTRTSMRPLAARRRSDGGWKQVRTPAPSRGGATLVDVAAFKRPSAWAVGYRLGNPGVHRPFALKWVNGRWRQLDPVLAKHERGVLAGVSFTKKGGAWAAGTVMRNGWERPYVVRRKDGDWRRMTLPGLGRASLAAITAPAVGDVWAVGHQLGPYGIRPLILHRDGTDWDVVLPPSLEGNALLMDVAVSDGVVTVVGSTWTETSARMRAFSARRQGGTWEISVLRSMPGHAAMTAVKGDPNGRGWAVGRSLRTGVAVKTCAEVGPAAARVQTIRRRRRAAAQVAEREAADAETHAVGELAPPRAGLASAPPIEVAAAGNVRIRDRAKAAGLPTSTTSYGAVIADFDQDGRKDIFLGRHAARARLYMDRGASFQGAGIDFGTGDRHGCDAADVDGSGLPDLYCSFGGGRGLGVKANQLWIDPGSADPQLHPRAGGAQVPLGRGREVVVFDVDRDGRRDIVIGQQQNRVDSLPSLNQVYLGDGPASFQPLRRSGLDIGLGVTSLDDGDIDRDGRPDLVLTYHDPKAAGTQSGIRVYRNTKDGFVRANARFGVRSIGERDAELAKLDGDGKLDLVQLSGDRIRVSLQRDGKFKSVYERTIPGAVAVAAGDADGDGDRDLYVLRQKNSSSVKDLILFNRGSGRRWRAVAAPSRTGGRADTVLPIDHDQNGLTDFLVLNGRGSGKGPLQLISFYPKS